MRDVLAPLLFRTNSLLRPLNPSLVYLPAPSGGIDE
jgi:hypothetical protein